MSCCVDGLMDVVFSDDGVMSCRILGCSDVIEAKVLELVKNEAGKVVRVVFDRLFHRESVLRFDLYGDNLPFTSARPFGAYVTEFDVIA